MLAMARALMPDPTVLLLDEPSAGLAPAVGEVFETVADINRAGVTIVMIEQNARRALALADRGYVLEGGQNRFEGAGDALLADPQVAELYLGGGGAHGTGRAGRPRRRRSGRGLRPGRSSLALRRYLGAAGSSTAARRCRRACRPCSPRCRSGRGRVAVLVEVDRARRALVVDVVAVLRAPRSPPAAPRRCTCRRAGRRRLQVLGDSRRPLEPAAAAAREHRITASKFWAS